MQSQQRINNAIVKVNIIATIFVVMLHANVSVLFENTSFVFSLLYTMVDVAVPVFFFISAFLFYRNITNIRNQYGTKIKSRVKSLLIPYFLFSVAWMVIYSCCSLIPVVGGFINDSAFRSDWKTNVLSIIMGSYNPPMWYLRTLFLLQLISPLFYVIIKKSKYLFSILLFIVSYLLNVFFDIGYSTPLFWLPLFLAGIWCAVFFDEIYHRVSDVLAHTYVQIIVLGLFICIWLLAAWQNRMGNESGWIYYSFRVFGTLLIFALAVNRLGEKKCNHPIKNYTFIIYLLHYPVVQIIKRILFKILGHVLMAEWIIYILTILLTLAGTWLVGIVISRLFPRTWSLINGGRQPVRVHTKEGENGR